MRRDQSTETDVAVAAPEDATDLTAEEFPAGARLHHAVQVIGSAPTSPPAKEERPPTTRVPASVPRPSRPDPSVDLFGASVAAQEHLEEPAPGVKDVPVATPATPSEAEDLIVDLRSDEATELIHPVTSVHLTDSRTWVDAPQGWVRDEAGGLEWQTVVTAADRFDRWEIGIPLGLVSVDVLLFGPVGGERIAMGRRDALAEMVAETLRRGGHAIVSVSQHITQLDDSLLVTVTGTAATLRDRIHS